jgi:uncharacterized membrane protein YhaH (DUF805 family)
MQKIVDIFFSPDGRIPRGLWWATLFVYAIPMGFLLTLIKQSNPQLAAVFQLLIGIPFILVNGKRFHDRNKSAWWVLISFIPIIGGLWIFIECGFLAGTPGPNRFGFPNVFGSESKMMKKNVNQRVDLTRDVSRKDG